MPQGTRVERSCPSDISDERWRREWCAVNRQFRKWSDGEQWVTDRDGASEESENVITRSR